MHIVIFGLGDLYNIGGVQASYQDLLKHLVENGHTVSFYSHREEQVGKNFAYNFPDQVKFSFYKLHDNAQAKSQILSLVKVEDPDVVLVVNSGQASLPILSALYDGPWPVVLSERGGDEHNLIHNWYSKRQRQMAHLMADATHFLFPQYNRALPKWMDGQITNIPSLIHPSSIGLSEPGLPGQGKRYSIVYAGRLTFEKDVDLLIQAFSLLQGAHPDWDLHIYGDGEDRADLEILAAENVPKVEEPSLFEKLFRTTRSRPRISFHGSLSQPDLFEAYRRSHIFVLPSRAEGCPIAVREAMAHGVPSIGFAASSGVNAVIKDGRNGLLAGGVSNSDKVENLAACMAKLMVNGRLRAKMGSAGAADMAAYEPSKILREWELLLGTAAKRKEKRSEWRNARARAGGENAKLLLADIQSTQEIARTRNIRIFDDSLLYNNVLAKDPLDYAMLFGTSVFDPVAYSRANPHVKLRGLDPLAHYLLEGSLEGRTAGLPVDLPRYAQDHMQPEDVTNPLVHMLRENVPEADIFPGDERKQETLRKDREAASRIASACSSVDPEALRGLLRRYKIWQRVDISDCKALPRETISRKGSQPLVTVVIPAFNAEGTLIEAIRSAECQTYEQVQVLVIDDGSTDDTMLLLNTLQRHVNNLDWFKQDNRGLSGARNLGLDLAKGEFILFHDADDVLHREAVAALVEAAQRTDATIVGGVFRIVGERTATPVSAFMRDEVIRSFRKDEEAASLYSTNFSFCNKLIKRDFLLEGGRNFRESLYMQDIELWLRLMFAIPLYVQLPIVVSDYVQGENTGSRQRTEARFDSLFRLFDLIEEEYDRNGWKKEKQYAHGAILQGAASFFVKWKLDEFKGEPTKDLLRLQAMLRRIPGKDFVLFHTRKNAGPNGLAAALLRQGHFVEAKTILENPSRHRRLPRDGTNYSFDDLIEHAKQLAGFPVDA